MYGAVHWRTEAWAWLWCQESVRRCGLEPGCGVKGRNPRVSVSKVIILGPGLVKIGLFKRFGL
ncbi:udp-n-acetylglucosamine--n-acetylmuramyl- (pentapeptide) pyrophosphoryl-undecaprenol n-acetylglucosamine transferase [Gossypium arboreum]|uniref:Udp-n-acetylglucosamine--n-acetylmuramyl-(Pentapeptide) pyrophosphoryl-undecaprenol n-acetylglucosamine transferase n=1 Tax=Gossypium arboreum TaxID=29729 RepID=A0A0B0N7I4_GOSAR|nr:udp-n-acetylglucosamine--n-acetylmuramyl- (pentapeptide) pyrophosphoryl-undecaprenol n-acetylglucosamine transferase [Gossypium arboreum]